MPRRVKMSSEAPGVTVVGAGGRELTLRRGLAFADRPSATAFFQDFAKAQGKRLVINKRKSGGAQYEYVCASRAPACGFRIKLLKSRSAQSAHFFVSSFSAEHAPDCAGEPKLSVRQAAAALLAAHADSCSSAGAGAGASTGDATADQGQGACAAAAAAASVGSVKELQARLARASGETISARKAYRVRDRLLRLAAGPFARGFRRLESLLRGFRAKNPGAHVAFETETSAGGGGVFRRAFLSHPFARPYLQSRGLQPVLGLDTAPLVSINYRGHLFLLTAKDGDDQTLPLAVGVAAQANAEAWRWFLRQCHDAQLELTTRVVVADLSRSLLQATQPLGLTLRQCTRHIVANLEVLAKQQATRQVRDLVWRAQAAETQEEFHSCLQMVGLTCPAAETYLRGLDPRSWALFGVAQQTPLFGWSSTNAPTHELRASLLCLAPYDLVQHYMEQFMTLAYAQATRAKRWLHAAQPLTDYAERLLAEQRQAATFQVVQACNDSVAFVTESRSFPPRRYRVDVTQRTCSCAAMFQRGLPCRHFLAALAYFKRSPEAVQCLDACYTVQAFAEQYDPQRTGSIELLLDSELQEDPAVQPPVLTRKRGRPKSKQLPTSGQVLEQPKHQGGAAAGLEGGPKRRCSSCGQAGHSKRTCERDGPTPSGEPTSVQPTRMPDMLV